MDNTQNNSEQDFEDVAGADDGIPEEGEVATTPIKFSPEMLTAKRAREIVEVNLSTGETRIVEASDMPQLTPEILKTKGAPIQTGQTLLGGRQMTVDVRHGIPRAVEIERQQLLETYKDREQTLDLVIEKDQETKRLMLTRMIVVDGGFSYQGQPAEAQHPIEDVDEFLIDALWAAYAGVTYPQHDDWYHVQVRRGIPMEIMLMLSNTFEAYPLGEGRLLTEMPEEDRIREIERDDAKRAIFVSSLIDDPHISLNGEGEPDAYPFESLSEGMLQCLYNAVSAVNTCREVTALLRRFHTDRKNRVGQGGNA